MTTEARHEVVELVYRPTTDDAVEMLRARMRRTPAGRRVRTLLWCGALGGLAGLAALLAVGLDVPPAVPAGLCGLSGAAIALLVVSPRLQARQIQRMAETHGEHRAVVDDTGVRWTTPAQEVASTWQALPRYTETPRLFVLISGDEPGLGLACLPKRALAPGDVDRLRAVLDRNTKRL